MATPMHLLRAFLNSDRPKRWHSEDCLITLASRPTAYTETTSEGFWIIETAKIADLVPLGKFEHAPSRQLPAPCSSWRAAGVPSRLSSVLSFGRPARRTVGLESSLPNCKLPYASAKWKQKLVPRGDNQPAGNKDMRSSAKPQIFPCSGVIIAVG